MLSDADNLQLHLWESVTYSAASRLLELSVEHAMPVSIQPALVPELCAVRAWCLLF